MVSRATCQTSCPLSSPSNPGIPMLQLYLVKELLTVAIFTGDGSDVCSAHQSVGVRLHCWVSVELCQQQQLSQTQICHTDGRKACLHTLSRSPTNDPFETAVSENRDYWDPINIPILVQHSSFFRSYTCPNTMSEKAVFLEHLIWFKVAFISLATAYLLYQLQVHKELHLEDCAMEWIFFSIQH